jgi:hypothetical protein
MIFFILPDALSGNAVLMFLNQNLIIIEFRMTEVLLVILDNRLPIIADMHNES